MEKNETGGNVLVCPLVRTWRFNCQVLGLIPSQGTKILQDDLQRCKKINKRMKLEHSLITIYKLTVD